MAVRNFRRGGPASFPESDRKAKEQDFAQLEKLLSQAPPGITVTVIVPCGTLTYVDGVLTDKGAC